MDNEITISNSGLTITQDNLIAEASNFVKDLQLPANYDVNSATKSFYLQLLEVKDRNGKSAMEVCTPTSVVNSLQTMLNYGLTPEKKQCALIIRGDKLCCHIEYFGWVKLAKTYAGVRIASQVVRKGERVILKTRPDGTLIITHKPKWECANNPIVGAYAVATDLRTGVVVNSEIMTMQEIQTSWLQSSNKGLETHKKFPHEMARKTVEARLAKHLVNKSDDTGKFDDFDDYVILDGDTPVVDADLIVDSDNIEDLNEEVTEPSGELPDLGDLGTLDTDKPDADGWFEVYYTEYKNNKDKYIGGEYNRFTKKIKVKLKETVEETPTESVGE